MNRKIILKKGAFLLACKGGDKNKWCLNTGCSDCMCGIKKLFIELDEFFQPEVKFGNNASIPILGEGKIAIKLKDGSENCISNVFYVLNLQQNLLNLG